MGLGKGLAVGAVGGGGVLDEATIPLGALGGTDEGAIAGDITGLIACRTGSGGASGGGDSASGRNGRFWKSLKNFRQKIKTNGLSGRARRYYQFDFTHNDIEVYDALGRHLGSADPETGAMTKPAVPGRRIPL